MTKWLSILQDNDYLAAKKLIKDGADLNDRTEAGESVLAYALKCKCDQDMLELLIESGADIFYKDDEGVSIFDFAITYNNMYVIKLLLDKGIDVNETSRRSGFTALMAAVCYGRNTVVKMLLDAGADVHAADSKGLTALAFAKKMHKKSMIELLEPLE
ncbi:ankyrin repeat domain-containing protein [Sulfurimonas sp. HSL3-7]|uniref:ankyrin repeat domain-containing protein n=1 Tax=Sulfonitrofixus jiaomeiensis TaxID=3131938 RepID=UPI0031F7B63D